MWSQIIILRGSLISIHASLMGCDASLAISSIHLVMFQSTHPSWDVIISLQPECWPFLFQSSRPAWSVIPCHPIFFAIYQISIHISLTECDYSFIVDIIHHRYFNQHASCGTRQWCSAVCIDLWNCNPRPPDGTRLFFYFYPHMIIMLQSTHPSRDVTLVVISPSVISKCFNPHIPRGMWLRWRTTRWMPRLFQSTHLSRDVTLFLHVRLQCCCVSIHTSLAGCDCDDEIECFKEPRVSIHTSLAGCDGNFSQKTNP